MERRIAMRRIAGAAIAALCLLAMHGCSGASLLSAAEDATTTEQVLKDVELLELNFTTGDTASLVTADLTLPTTGSGGSTITWSSDHPDIIDNSGKVVRPSKDTTVILTATITKGDKSQTKAFSVTVKASEVPVSPGLANFPDIVKYCGDGPFTLTPPSSKSNGQFTYSSGNPAVATISGNTVTITGQGVSTITATQAASENYLSESISATLTVNLTPPTLSNFNPLTKNYKDVDFPLAQPSSNSSGAFTYTSSNTNVATIVSGNTVHINHAGTTTITANQAAEGNYGPGTINASLTVNPISAPITFNPFSKNYGDAAFTPTCSSDSTGAFTFTSSNTAVATASGSTVTIVFGGTTIITATQAATNDYTSGIQTATMTVNAVLPTVSTNPISSIHATSASGGGNVTSHGGATVTARGVCWNTTGSPTTAGSHTTDGSGTGSFASSLTGLTLGQTYYVRAYAINSAGTAYGSPVSFQAVLALGDSYQGGIIFSISGTYPSQHGLIAYATDLGGLTWANTGDTGANGTAVGTGSANTDAIIGSGLAFDNCAAWECYYLDAGGYSDWYLPSKDELVLLMQNKSYVGGFGQPYYWSSTQYGTGYAWAVQSSNAIARNDLSRIYGCYVRPVRSF